MDKGTTRCIRRVEEKIYGGTSIDDAWPYETIPDRNGCLKICNRSSAYTTRCEQWLKPCLIYIKDIFPSRKELRDLRPRALGNCQSTRGMATLHTGIPTYDDSLVRPQESDLLPGSQETEQTTGEMVTIPIRIRCQAGTHTGTQDGSIRYTVPTTRPLPGWRQR